MYKKEKSNHWLNFCSDNLVLASYTLISENIHSSDLFYFALSVTDSPSSGWKARGLLPCPTHVRILLLIFILHSFRVATGSCMDS